MKNLILTVFIFASIVITAGCSKKNEGIGDEQAFQETLFQSTKSIVQDKVSGEETSSGSGKFDLDFTKFNYNMITAVTYEIIVSPAKYKDKTVRITGKFATEVNEGIRYYGALVWDPTGCCPAGLDFVPPENMHYPEDFPKNNTKITVTGTLTEVTDENGSYIRFFADSVQVLE